MVEIRERNKYWEVIINSRSRTNLRQLWLHGIIRHWEKTPKSWWRLRQVDYPKKRYSLADVKRIVYIEKKYEDCKLCKIGTKNLKFKYTKNNNKNMVGKDISIGSGIQKVGRKIKKRPGYVMSETTRRIIEEWTLQSLSQLIGNWVDFGLKPVAAKLVDALIGIGGTIGIAKLPINQNVKNELLTFLANWGTKALDPSPQDAIAIAENIREIQAAIRGRLGFQGVSDAMVRSPAELRAAIATIRKAAGMTFGRLRGFGRSFYTKIGKKGRFRRVPTTHSLGKSEMGAFATAEASDYGLETSKWFKDVSRFSPNFLNKNRFKISGEAHEI